MKIAEPICINSKGLDGKQPSLHNRIYDSDGIATACTTVPFFMPSYTIKEPQALRMVRTEEGKRLRKQYEAHEIECGFNEHMVAEPRDDGCSNTLSTVQKDNYIVEPVLNCIGMVDGKSNEMCRRVYNADGISPTILSNSAGGNIPPKVSVPCIGAIRGRNPENPSDRTAGIPTQQRLEVGGDCSNTLTTVQKDNVVIEPSIRVRKLTPRECFRLMDFTDDDFDKASDVNSNSQLYKQAGNSIVVNCLTAILGQMFEGKEDYYKHEP